MWNIDYRNIEEWLDSQDEKTVALIFAALEVLQAKGPSLGRPLVDSIQGSKVRNLKELRPASRGQSEIRILFAFDPRRSAVLLYAGNKASGKSARSKWTKWYRQAVPLAERAFDAHVAALEREHG